MVSATSVPVLRLRNLGYRPGAPTADGREFASYPYPIPGGGYGVAVREVGDPGTLTRERVPDEAVDLLDLGEEWS